MTPFDLASLGSVTTHVEDETWTPERLRQEVAGRAAAYASAGVGRGDRVILLHSNTARFFGDLLACWWLGATVSAMDPTVGGSEFDGLVDELAPKLVVVDGGPPEKLTSAASSIMTIDTREVGRGRDAPPPALADLDDAALVLFTSGSTGLPKGVVHSFRSLRSKWQTLRAHVPLDLLQTTLCVLPTHFGHGLICNSLYPLLHGKDLVLLPKADMGTLAALPEVLDRYQVTFMSSVPAVWRIVLRVCRDKPKPTLRQVHVGSAPLSAELWRDVRAWTGTDRVWNTYGITETGSWVAGPALDDPMLEPTDGLVGVGWGAEIAISSGASMADVDASSPTLPQGEAGYVWLRTAAAMQRYLNRPEQTADVLQGGWFSTGDIGLLDDRGYLHLTGRARNEINKGGTKVSPEELDLAIERHPVVMEACAFGVDDKVLGQDIGACIVVAEGQPPPTAGELMKWLAGQLSDVKVPRHWYVVEAIPKTSRGKVNREQVASHCRDLQRLR